MNLILIEDVHVEWHGETGDVRFYVEFPGGEEQEIASIVPESEPKFPTEGCEEGSDYEFWYNECLAEARKQGYVLVDEGDIKQLCFIKKENFVNRLSYAVSGRGNISNIANIRYEVYQSKKNPEWYQEYVVVTFDSGAISPRTVNGDSHSAIYREIGKLVDGGYYDEVKDYNELRTSGDWILMNLAEW